MMECMLLSKLTLSDYVAARTNYCRFAHDQNCQKCLRMTMVGNRNGFCTLAEAYQIVSPNRADNARSKLLQMPLVCI